MSRSAGLVIRKMRKDAGMTQGDLARVLKRSVSYVSRVENGQREIEVTDLITFSFALKQDPVDALDRCLRKK